MEILFTGLICISCFLIGLKAEFIKTYTIKEKPKAEPKTEPKEPKDDNKPTQDEQWVNILSFSGRRLKDE